MPKPDIYHVVVRNALIKDGWTITHDPLVLSIGKKRLFVDLGASRLLSAQKGERKIAVEIKSFTGPSDVYDLEQVLGQYLLYHKILKKQSPNQVLYLAANKLTFESVFNTELGALLLEDEMIHLLVFDDKIEDIIQWLPDWTIEI